MSQFEILTKYIPLIEQDELGVWMPDQENDGKFNQLAYVSYSLTIISFIEDVYDFIDNREDLNLSDYKAILEKNKIGYNKQEFKDADISALDGQCLVALILAIDRADRFSEGTLLHFLKEGYITKWLKRLKEIDCS